MQTLQFAVNFPFVVDVTIVVDDDLAENSDPLPPINSERLSVAHRSLKIFRDLLTLCRLQDLRRAASLFLRMLNIN